MKILNISMVPWVNSIHGELRDRDGKPLRKFDNTKLVALNTWGIVRYEHHKTYLSGSRAMALEAGGAAHEAYAAVRLADLYFNGPEFYRDADFSSDVQRIATARATTIFGEERTAGWLSALTSGEDTERATMLAALEIFGTSGYYEDPGDRKRTIANIEEALIAYVTRYPLGKTMPIIVKNGLEGIQKSEWFVGVEIGIDMYLEITTDEPSDTEYGYNGTHINRVRRYHFVGRVDGLQYIDRTLSRIAVEENKTASRLDDAWRLAFTISHQPTGYMLAASNLLGQLVQDAVIRGMSIPLPKTFDYGGIVNEPITRNLQNFKEWAEWVCHTMDVTAPFLDTPENAPKYTHSCNRYFRPCPLIPFCDSDYDERRAMLDEMATDEWDPLEEGNG